jgi:acyl carrier protein
MTAFSVDRVPALLRAELAAVTGEPESVFTDDALLGDVGIDSLALIEALMSVRDQILEDMGLGADDVDEPPTLPWIETVGELIAYVRSSIPATVTGE